MGVTRILTAVLTLIIVPSLTAGASPRDDGPQDFGPGLVAFGPQTPPFDAQEEINRSTEEGGAEAFPLVRFRWPHVMTDWWAVSNYVDLSAPGTILDYECQAVSYDGHNGNDIIIRDFYAQKEGYFVLAAADGVVIETADGNQDESTIGCEGPANFVILQHLDGTYSYYWHLRKWSVLVTPGDGVYEPSAVGF